MTVDPRSSFRGNTSAEPPGVGDSLTPIGRWEICVLPRVLDCCRVRSQGETKMLWFFLLAGLAIIGLAYYALQRESKGDSSFKLPFFGEVNTSVPAVSLVALAVVSLFFAYMLKAGEDQAASATVKTITFHGQVEIDPDSVSDISSIEVGVTSAPWILNQTPDKKSPTINVTIPVPDSWQSYTAYAFALGGPKVRPVVVGASLNDPNFKLRIGP